MVAYTDRIDSLVASTPRVLLTSPTGELVQPGSALIA